MPELQETYTEEAQKSKKSIIDERYLSIIKKQLAYGDGAIIVKPCTIGFFAESIIQEIKIEIKMESISQMEDQLDSPQIS